MRVLCIGAHVDDIELGCGGTLHKHCKRQKDWVVDCLVLSLPVDVKAIGVAQQSLALLGVASTSVCNLPVDCLAASRQSVWDHIWSKIEETAPTRIITVSSDLHQDHETVYKETMRASVGVNQVLTYDIAISHRAPFSGTYYEALAAEDLDAKVSALELYSDCTVSSGRRTVKYGDKIYMQSTAVRAQATAVGSSVRDSLAEVFSVERFFVE